MPNADRPRPALRCQVCGRTLPRRDLEYAALVRPSVAEHIAREHPDWSAAGYVCRDDLARYRRRHIEALVAEERGEISTIDRSVIESMAQYETLAKDVDKEFQGGLSFGERVADRVADLGGSWPFILVFLGFLVVWMLVNGILLVTRPFDPFPFILLNLVLSCIAALQAPVIMMSQNRQEARDRLRAQNDYRVNLKAELEIRQLGEKLDYLVQRQWERLLEIQEIQIDLMNELQRDERRPT